MTLHDIAPLEVLGEQTACSFLVPDNSSEALSNTVQVPREHVKLVEDTVSKCFKSGFVMVLF